MIKQLFLTACLQLLIFLGYLIPCSFVLRNHQGGADILVALLISIAAIIHLAILVVQLAKQRDLQHKASVLSLLVIVSVFYAVFDEYLKLMWKLTS